MSLAMDRRHSFAATGGLPAGRALLPASSLEGPAMLLGDNPFPPVGGTGTVWSPASETVETVQLTAVHSRLGSRCITLTPLSANPEEV